MPHVKLERERSLAPKRKTYVLIYWRVNFGKLFIFPKPWLSLLRDEDCGTSQGNPIIHAFYLCLLRMYYAAGSDTRGIM